MKDILIKLIDKNYKIKDIAEETGISTSAVKRRLKKYNLKTNHTRTIVPLEKETLIEMINSGLSTYQISKKINKSQTSVRHWLKKYNLETNYTNLTKKSDKEYRICPKCKQELHKTNFYKKKGINFDSAYCKPCTSIQTMERMIDFKLKCVEYKGGKCINCGYNKYYGALEFHHLNPEEKDFNISNIRTYKFNKRITEELDKCVLLCANCHREEHYNIIQNKINQGL